MTLNADTIMINADSARGSIDAVAETVFAVAISVEADTRDDVNRAFTTGGFTNVIRDAIYDAIDARVKDVAP